LGFWESMGGCACGYSKSEKGTQFTLAVFSKSVVLRIKWLHCQLNSLVILVWLA